MNPGEVEFVAPGSDPDHSDSDVLDVGRDRRAVSRRTQLIAAAVAAVALVAWIVTRPGTTTPRPAAAPPTTDFSAVPVIPSTPEPVWTVACDETAACSVSIGDQSSVIAALVAHLQDARLVSGQTTVKLEHGSQAAIAERTLDVKVGSANLLVRITPYLHPVATPGVDISPTPSGVADAFFHFETASFVIDEQWSSQAAAAPAAALEDLAQDSRLEAL